MSSTVGKAVTKYFKSTTLHGFKYLVSPHKSDRVWWAICCIASACCAGVLCDVLWGRFLALPAVITMPSMVSKHNLHFPQVVVCQRPENVIDNFISKVAANGVNGFNKTTLLAGLSNALQSKTVDKKLLQTLDQLVEDKAHGLTQLFMDYSLECELVVRLCRMFDVPVPCEKLFFKRLSPAGYCCAATMRRLSNYERSLPFYIRYPKIGRNFKLELVLYCGDDLAAHGCSIIAEYNFGHKLTPVALVPGNIYHAQLRTIDDVDENDGKLVANCVLDERYTMRDCLDQCIIKKCGCYNFLKVKMPGQRPCLLTQYHCFKSEGFRESGGGNTSCNCLPKCFLTRTKLTVQSIKLQSVQHSIDPLRSLVERNGKRYENVKLNESQSIMFRLVIHAGDHKILSALPTETWFSFLSSMGGVFNMFLGVGLFSALEIAILLLIKLPFAIWRMLKNYSHA